MCFYDSPSPSQYFVVGPDFIYLSHYFNLDPFHFPPVHIHLNGLNEVHYIVYDTYRLQSTPSFTFPLFFFYFCGNAILDTHSFLSHFTMFTCFPSTNMVSPASQQSPLSIPLFVADSDSLPPFRMISSWYILLGEILDLFYQFTFPSKNPIQSSLSGTGLSMML